MAESIVSDVVSKLLEWFIKSAIDEIAPYFGGERRLKELEQTMVMIQARLVDAERRGEGDNGEAMVKAWLKRLKRVLYRLEDLFEEVSIADKEKEQVPGGKLTKPIRLFCSCSNSLKMNKEVAKEAKAIREELNSITLLMNSLNFREGENPRVVNVDSSRETHSLVRGEEVIGRDEDKNKIVAMLLKSDDCRENVSVIPIVGIGGLGKTTLAQLVFNDKDVQKHFERKCWACISDVSSLHELAGKILTSLISEVGYRQLTLDQIQSQLHQAVNGKKYLLVFDDIWDEDRGRWLELKKFLFGGKKGSKIIVTTRSKVVAQNMGTVEPHELKGLSKDKSWDLFRSLAFKPGQEEGNPNLARIGKGIVKKCANVPLAVKTIACLLYSMNTEIEWEDFKDKDLPMIKENDNSILSTLKLSYDRLAPQLKQCFAYCSLFPKDHILRKRDLINLWMSQGFLGSSSSGHNSLEDIGHGLFMQLTRRCFFQDIKMDEDGEIVECKMHDLVHDLAQLVTGGDSLLVDERTKHISDNILHVSFCNSPIMETRSWLLTNKQMRSFFHLHGRTDWLNIGVFSSLRFLRAVYVTEFESLPESLGELKHLRYLKICGDHQSLPECICLPECITRLHNLQTLDLTLCRRLSELPMGFSKLINLRHLHLPLFCTLDDMPPGFGQLTSLRALDYFVVGESNGLDALATLVHLAGFLRIVFVKRHRNGISKATVGILKPTKLTNLELKWKGQADADVEEDELALRCMQPPQTLKRLKFQGHVYQHLPWQGVTFPSWGMDELPCFLPNLVQVQISYCKRCQHLPPLSRLPHLRSLALKYLDALEYIDNGGINIEASSAAAAPYFPALEALMLLNLPNLKGWSREEAKETTTTTTIHPQTENVENHRSLLPCPSFPRLSKLTLVHCPKLKSMPLTLRLDYLDTRRVHEKVIKHLLRAEQKTESELGSPTTYLPHSSYLSSLQRLTIRSALELESLSIINLCSLEDLEIVDCPDLISLTLGSPMPSLRRLHISECSKLRDILPQNLAILDRLTIKQNFQSLVYLILEDLPMLTPLHISMHFPPQDT